MSFFSDSANELLSKHFEIKDDLQKNSESSSTYYTNHTKNEGVPKCDREGCEIKGRHKHKESMKNKNTNFSDSANALLDKHFGLYNK